MRDIEINTKPVTLPNFMIVGAAKSGTTSLYHYLKQHPDVYMPDLKEPLFFCFYGLSNERFSDTVYPNDPGEYIRDFQGYLSLFSANADSKAVGEASAGYLFYYKRTIENIKKLLPNWREIKIIIILRNPVDASFSHYLMYRMRGDETLTFEDAIEHEKERIKAGKGIDTLIHFERFFYYNQVKAYMENFTQVRVYLYDDLMDDAFGMVRDIFEFLDVDSSFVPRTDTKYNMSGIPKNLLLHKLLTTRNILRVATGTFLKVVLSDEKALKLYEYLRSKNLKKAKMKPETRELLKRLYREDILKLQGLINRDLEHWLR